MIVTDGDAVKVTYAHNIDATQTFGGEAVKHLNKEMTSFTLGYAKKLQAASLFKARLSNSGACRALLFLPQPSLRELSHEAGQPHVWYHVRQRSRKHCDQVAVAACRA